jgi:hypothetical protein
MNTRQQLRRGQPSACSLPPSHLLTGQRDWQQQTNFAAHMHSPRACEIGEGQVIYRADAKIKKLYFVNRGISASCKP